MQYLVKNILSQNKGQMHDRDHRTSDKSKLACISQGIGGHEDSLQLLVSRTIKWHDNDAYS